MQPSDHIDQIRALLHAPDWRTAGNRAELKVVLSRLDHSLAAAVPTPDWGRCQAIADAPEVDAALECFANDPTGDEAVCLIRSILAEAAPASAAEPVAYEFQHEDTGQISFVDPQQVEWGFERANPRHQRIGPVYRHPPAPPPAAVPEHVKALRSIAAGNVSWPVEGGTHVDILTRLEMKQMASRALAAPVPAPVQAPVNAWLYRCNKCGREGRANTRGDKLYCNMHGCRGECLPVAEPDKDEQQAALFRQHSNQETDHGTE